MRVGKLSRWREAWGEVLEGCLVEDLLTGVEVCAARLSHLPATADKTLVCKSFWPCPHYHQLRLS